MCHAERPVKKVPERPGILTATAPVGPWIAFLIAANVWTLEYDHTTITRATGWHH